MGLELLSGVHLLERSWGALQKGGNKAPKAQVATGNWQLQRRSLINQYEDLQTNPAERKEVEEEEKEQRERQTIQAGSGKKECPVSAPRKWSNQFQKGRDQQFN